MGKCKIIIRQCKCLSFNNSYPHIGIREYCNNKTNGNNKYCPKYKESDSQDE